MENFTFKIFAHLYAETSYRSLSVVNVSTIATTITGSIQVKIRADSFHESLRVTIANVSLLHLVHM